VIKINTSKYGSAVNSYFAASTAEWPNDHKTFNIL